MDGASYLTSNLVVRGNDVRSGGKGRAEHHASPTRQEQKNSTLSKSTKVSPTSSCMYITQSREK